jgi:phosphoribosyl-ATP pyrophosphohydrolase/phosphoribosyl-AMP cyclohydrolase
MIDLDKLDFSKSGGLVTVVAQHAVTGAVLMVAHADREALERTIETREMHYRSRTRGLWHKGATSGNTQKVVSMTTDCDGDAILARVISNGPACHTGSTSCFGSARSDAIDELDTVIAERRSQPEQSKSYTQKLLGDRNLRLKKLGEEAAELVVALADNDADRAVEEAADLIYHTIVALRANGRSYSDVKQVLFNRRPAADR